MDNVVGFAVLGTGVLAYFSLALCARFTKVSPQCPEHLVPSERGHYAEYLLPPDKSQRQHEPM